MKNGGLTLWSALAICEMVKTSWQMGELPHERRYGEHAKERSFRSEQCLYFSDLCKRPVKAPPSCEEGLAKHFPRIRIGRREESGKEIFWLQTLRSREN